MGTEGHHTTGGPSRDAVSLHTISTRPTPALHRAAVTWKLTSPAILGPGSWRLVCRTPRRGATSDRSPLHALGGACERP